jgi:hypothetical protein
MTAAKQLNPAPAAFDICPVIYQTCGSSAALSVFACYLQASEPNVRPVSWSFETDP